MPVMERLQLWMDRVKRPGPEAMAVDEWLLETIEVPMLRVYDWQGEWGSVGYFGRLETARDAFPELEWVRRWTGGGTVDHRADWTYTLVVPTGLGLIQMRGVESYRILHEALARALCSEGSAVRLGSGTGSTGNTLCFENPVAHDLINPAGSKIAGAGQRRTRRGLLHQGSVAAPCDEESSRKRSECLAGLLARQWWHVDLQPPREWLAGKIHSRYGAAGWTVRC